MIKEHSSYLEHPSNDMLRSAKILEDINGQKSYGVINRIAVSLGIALFISLQGVKTKFFEAPITLSILSKAFSAS